MIPEQSSTAQDGASSPLVIPEILTIILSFLDRNGLLTSTAVARVWHESALPLLWGRILNPPLIPEFFAQLSRNGPLVQHLDLTLHTENGASAIVPIELTRILKATPRLKSLALHLSHQGTPQTVSSLLRTIKGLVANQLTSLSLCIGVITAEDANEFFPSLSSIKKLKLTRCSSSAVVKAIANAQVDHPTGVLELVTTTIGAEGVHINVLPEEQLFDNEALIRLGKALPHLRHLSTVNNVNLTSAGLIDFSSYCKTLTRLNFEWCSSIEPLGLEALIQTSASLTHVYLGNTQTSDLVLFSLASPPARAANLQVLSVSHCRNVTSQGIQSIVKVCENLRELEFTLNASVMFDVFEEPAWASSRLQRLLMNGIHDSENMWPGNFAVTAPLEPQQGPVTERELTNMYRQLGRLEQLQELHLGGTKFDLRLFDVGRTCMEGLRRLRFLRVPNLKRHFTQKELIWLATRLGGLRQVEISMLSAQHSLLRDLIDINPMLEFKEMTFLPSEDLGVHLQLVEPPLHGEPMDDIWPVLPNQEDVEEESEIDETPPSEQEEGVSDTDDDGHPQHEINAVHLDGSDDESNEFSSSERHGDDDDSEDWYGGSPSSRSSTYSVDSSPSFGCDDSEERLEREQDAADVERDRKLQEAEEKWELEQDRLLQAAEEKWEREQDRLLQAAEEKLEREQQEAEERWEREQGRLLQKAEDEEDAETTDEEDDHETNYLAPTRSNWTGVHQGRRLKEDNKEGEDDEDSDGEEHQPPKKRVRFANGIGVIFTNSEVSDDYSDSEERKKKSADGQHDIDHEDEEDEEDEDEDEKEVEEEELDDDEEEIDEQGNAEENTPRRKKWAMYTSGGVLLTDSDFEGSDEDRSSDDHSYEQEQAEFSDNRSSTDHGSESDEFEEENTPRRKKWVMYTSGRVLFTSSDFEGSDEDGQSDDHSDE